MTNKLHEWTKKRWIILFSKQEGFISKKQEIIENKNMIFENFKRSEKYKKILEILPDADLEDVKPNVQKKNDWF